ncbi:suppressor of fused domain protein [Micromonospora musae]|uniref:Suppressor of fused domain protein n=1 Tax=Micromonospora musae TaxID=1894970 RepID=A0A3A9XPM2_9ACTN|nr:suppressor of fused domain protein [Micromonospora musae]RKN16504.1 suppressor of fused domain protein [Micromonospora musae]RKN27270.1 suppressor of fused domain protein [Micromonospora musae]
MTSEAPGWDAIDARLAELYPDVEPKHYGTLHRFALGGPDPLDGVSFYPRDEPVPHWHVVGYGMSELYAKESDNPDESGWGFEFTIRPARDIGETEPPMWAASLLQNLARYVFSSGNWFEPGHHMNANGPIRLDYETELTALAFTEDPELGTIPTPHGRVQFLQVVGLTGDEYAAARQWDTDGVLHLFAERVPMLVTDLDRPSITDDPAVRAAIEEGRARDGSSTGLLMIAGFDWTAEQDTVRLRFADVTTTMVAEAVRDRLSHGRVLLLDNTSTRVVLQRAEVFAARRPDDGLLEVDLPAEAVAALPDVLVPGVHPVPGTSHLVVEVSTD